MHRLALLLSPLPLLLPSAAFAADPAAATPREEVITGKVAITPNHLPDLPPAVSLVAAGKTVLLGYPLAADVGGFHGKIVTVKGSPSSTQEGAFQVSEFAPGPSRSFLHGQVVKVGDDFGIQRVGAATVLIDDPRLNRYLEKLVGAEVILHGATKDVPCPPGATCPSEGSSWFTWRARSQVLVKGVLSRDPHALNGESYTLDLPGGATLEVAGAGSYPTTIAVWMTGRLGSDPIGGEVRLTATRDPVVVLPYPLIHLPGPSGSGSSVGLNDPTTSAPGGRPEPGEGTGAGQTR